jgi:hypothetical protein
MRLPQSFTGHFSTRSGNLTPFKMSLLAVVFAMSVSAAHSQLVFTPSPIRFGSIDVGQTETLYLSISNSGQSSVTISSMAVSNSAFNTSGLTLPATLAAGESVGVNVSFAPGSTGYQTSTLKVFSSANPATIEASGSGVTAEAVGASPASVSFGQVALGSTANAAIVLTNNRTWKVTLLSSEISGTGFSVSGQTFPLTLKAGESATLNASFTPLATGAAGGSLFITGPGLSIPLSGSGGTAAQLTANPSSLSFGNVQDGSSATLTDSLTNTGGSSVTISQAAVSGSGFSFSGLTLPLTLNAGASVTFNVTFAPQATGNTSGDVLVSSNASDSSLNLGLTGDGVAPQAYSVSLSWQDGGTGVSGYNVFRGTSNGGPYSQINSSLDANPSYTDNSVAPGETYYYVVTAVNTSGQQSGYSNQTTAQVP